MSPNRELILELAVLTVIGAIGLALYLYSTSREAHANALCAATCNTQHDQCLAKTNDRYTCDSLRISCLKSCAGG